MALKPQSIRKGVIILLDTEETDKQTIIELSESWTEQQVNFFKKMLKQGGEFRIQGRRFNITPATKIVNSIGQKDGGVVQIPGERAF